MNNVILECKQLTKTYDEAHSKIEVLKKIDLTLHPSELVAIVGNSGSGKSTLLHLLGGLDKPTSGDVILNGKNLNSASEAEKCRLRNHYLGFVYQFHHLLPEFSALENVAMPLLIRGSQPIEIEKKAKHLLELVGLQDRMQHKIGELSGGERQRVAIARALVTDPLCVLADEPTGNLDSTNADKVLNLFIDLQKTFKTSVMIVTHDRGIAKRAERIMSLERGQLVML
jgi:lipoprotein-releasing system ATP-binding protein